MPEVLTLSSDRHDVSLAPDAELTGGQVHWETGDDEAFERAVIDANHDGANQSGGHANLDPRDEAEADLYAGEEIPLVCLGAGIFLGILNTSPSDREAKLDYWRNALQSGKTEVAFALQSLTPYLRPLSSPHFSAFGTRTPERDGYVLPPEAEAISRDSSPSAGPSRLKRLAATIVSAAALFGSTPASPNAAAPSAVEYVAAGRVVPNGALNANGTLIAKNWAGKLFSGDGSFNAVGANITIPEDIGCSGTEKLSEWVGILGDESGKTIGQAGFEVDCVLLGGNQPVLGGISLIAEAFPGPVKVLGSVQEGDVLHINMTYANGQYSVRINVNSSEKAYTAKVELPPRYSSNRSYVGIIMERSKQGGNYPLARFSPSPVSLIVHGRTGWRFPNGLPQTNVDMTNDNGRVVVADSTTLIKYGRWTNRYV